MSRRPEKCSEFVELLPLYYTRQLEQELYDAMHRHLDTCSDCRTIFAKERNLYNVAESKMSEHLDAHIDSVELDQYVRGASDLPAERRAEIEAHLSACLFCRETAEKLRCLPTNLDDLIEPISIPLITRLDAANSSSPAQTRITDLTSRSWKPMATLAAAAAIVIVAVTLFRSEGPVPSAVIEGNFPPVTRSVTGPSVFETAVERFEFTGRIFVDPEESHTYSLNVRDMSSGEVLLESRGTDVTIDSSGFAAFSLAMTPGKYELVVWDIEGVDSISVVRTFEVRLVP